MLAIQEVVGEHLKLWTVEDEDIRSSVSILRRSGLTHGRVSPAWGEWIVSRGSAVFLDTSIQIARLVHSADQGEEDCASRISEYSLTISSEVVEQEFKRRLLKEAQYLLNQLNRLNSFQKVQRHVIDNLPPQQNRKRNICLETLQTIFEERSDSDLTERAKSYLKIL